MAYTEMDLQLDIDWLDGYGVPRNEAKRMIQHIIKEMVKNGINKKVCER